MKCDEIKPACEHCFKRKVQCGGYRKDFKWRAFEETTFTTKPIPSLPSKSSLPAASQWTEALNSIASGEGSATVEPTLRTVESREMDAADESINFDLFPQAHRDCPAQPLCPLDSGLAGQSAVTIPHSSQSEPAIYTDAGMDPRLFHDPVLSATPSTTHSMFDDGGMLQSATFARTGFSNSTSPSLADLPLPGIDFRTPQLEDIQHQLQSGMPFDSVDHAPEHTGIFKLDEDVEEIGRPQDLAEDWTMCLPSPTSSQSSSSSEGSAVDLNSVFPFPRLSSRSPEMLMLRFDQQTCGILSVKDGPTENPWRTLVWPLAQDSPALYHAIVSMTAFHTSAEKREMRVEGIAHMNDSLTNLKSGIRDGSIRMDAALATTLALAFAESWDVHISTGIQHLRGAKTIVNQALAHTRKSNLEPYELDRLRFLCNTWVYMDVIARLTSLDGDESNDFDTVINATGGPFATHNEVDPLMGCASTLFPLVGRVANLVRKVRKTERNSINIISHANDLKNAVEEWKPPQFFEAPEDQTSNIQHSLDTAEAYRWATLLYLHQAVPEIPSLPSEKLVKNVIVYLLRVPLTSRAIIVQIYPLLAAGCELSSNEDRAWVEDRWAWMMRRMLIGNLDKCLEVVKEVWDRRDVDESKKARARLRTVPCRRLSRSSSQSHAGTEKIKRELGKEDRYSFAESSRQALGTHPSSSMPSDRWRNQPTEEILEELDFEKTVRGRLHWVGVMRDWNWEVLLG